MSLDGYHAVLVLGGIRSGKSEYAESLVAGVPDVHYVATAPAVPDDPEWSARLAAHRRRRPSGWLTQETGADPARLATLLWAARPDQTLLVDDLGGWLTAVLSQPDPESSAAGASGAAGSAAQPPSWAQSSTAPESSSAAEPSTATESSTAAVDETGQWPAEGTGQWPAERAGSWTAQAAEAPVDALVGAVRGCLARLVIVSPEVGLSVVPATTAGRVFADALGSANRRLADVCAAVVLVVAGQPSQLKPPIVAAGATGVAAGDQAATLTTATTSAPTTSATTTSATTTPATTTPATPTTSAPARPVTPTTSDSAWPATPATAAATESAAAAGLGVEPATEIQSDSGPDVEPAASTEAGEPAELSGSALDSPTLALWALVPTTKPRDDNDPDDESAEPAIEPGLTLPLPDDAAGLEARNRLAALDVPGAGLGKLTDAVIFAAAARGSATPARFSAVRVLLLHGLHQGGVAAGDSPAEWIRRVDQARRGEGPLGLLAGRVGARVDAVDLTGGQWPAANPIEESDANTPGQVARAVRYGRRLADAAVDEGTDLLVLAAGGPGQEAAAAAVVTAAGRADPAALLRRVYQPGGRIDDHAWMIRCAAVRDAVHRTRGRHKDPLDVLASLGGLDLAVAVGVLIGAAARRTPVLIDGPVGVAAGLVARDIAGQARLWLLLPDDSAHPTVRAGADLLGLDRLVELGLSLGEGTASLAALPLIQSALELATLSTVAADSAGV